MADDLDIVLADILPAKEGAPKSDPEAKPENPAKPKDEGQQQDETPDAEPEDEDADKADEPEDEGEDDQPEQPKKKSGSARWREKALEAQRELAQLRQQRQPTGDPASLAKAVEEIIGEPPKRDDYETYMDYEVARTAYEVDKRQATREVKQQSQRAQQSENDRFSELVEAFQDAEAEARKKIPDYDEVMKKARDIETKSHVDELILESDKGPLLKHYLAQRPKAVDELNRMSPIAAAREIGRLEARLSYPTPKTATKAPPPVKPPSSGTSAADGVNIDKDPSWAKFASKHGYK